jgi:hypothetical protein
MRFTPAAIAAFIQILSLAKRGFGRAETTTSWFLNAAVRADSLVRSTLILLAAPWAMFLESARWMAVTVKPALFKAVRILDPRFPVACGVLVVICRCFWGSYTEESDVLEGGHDGRWIFEEGVGLWEVGVGGFIARRLNLSSELGCW